MHTNSKKDNFTAIEDEHLVLGTMMGFARKIHTVKEKISKDMFYSPENRVIFETITFMYSQKWDITAQSVCKKLEADNMLDYVGGKEKVYEINGFINPLELTQSIERILALYVIRSRRDAAQAFLNTTESGGNLDMAYEAMISTYREVDMSISNSHSLQRDVDVFEEAVKLTIENREKGLSILGYQTTIPRLTELTDGWVPGQTVIIAARPSTGKTAFWLQEMENLRKQGIPGVFFSLETDALDVVYRMMADRMGVSPKNLMKGMINDDQLKQFQEYVNERKKLNIKSFIDDSSTLYLEDLQNKVAHLKHRHNIKWIAIDFVQLMATRRPGSIREKMEHIAKSLLDIARKHKIVVFEILQLSREAHGRVPELKHLKEAGGFEQSATKAILLHRPSLYGERTFDDGSQIPDGYTSFILAKNKRGERATGENAIDTMFNGTTMTFNPWDRNSLDMNSDLKYKNKDDSEEIRNWLDS